MHASLFSGIGGFDLAAQWVGWDNVFQVEKDKWCQRVLAKNYPNAKRYGDIKEFKGHEYKGAIDIIYGGFPCQPFSVAGNQRGKDDDRYLWDEMLRVVREVAPPFVVGENVTGIIGLALDTVLTDLEAEGYTTETFIIPACAKNAWHRRDRVWIVAYNESWFNRGYHTQPDKRQKQEPRESIGANDVPNITVSGFPKWRSKTVVESKQKQKSKRCSSLSPNANHPRCKEQCECLVNGAKNITPKCSSWWQAEPGVGRVVDGLPHRVDRLKGLGNAIVPQVAFEIFSAINKVTV